MLFRSRPDNFAPPTSQSEEGEFALSEEEENALVLLGNLSDNCAKPALGPKSDTTSSPSNILHQLHTLICAAFSTHHLPPLTYEGGKPTLGASRWVWVTLRDQCEASNPVAKLLTLLLKLDNCIQGLSSCNTRFCGICSHRTASLIARDLEKDFLAQKSQLWFLTLTIPASGSLKEGIHSVKRSWMEMRSHRSWRGHHEGGVWKVEATFNNGRWHVHFHIVVAGLYEDEVNNIIDDWTEVADARRDLQYGVRVERSPQSFAKVASYIAKPIMRDITDPAAVEEAIEVFAGSKIRLMQRFK